MGSCLFIDTKFFSCQYTNVYDCKQAQLEWFFMYYCSLNIIYFEAKDNSETSKWRHLNQLPGPGQICCCYNSTSSEQGILWVEETRNGRRRAAGVRLNIIIFGAWSESLWASSLKYWGATKFQGKNCFPSFVKTQLLCSLIIKSNYCVCSLSFKNGASS